MGRFLFVILFCCFSIVANSSEGYMFRVYLKDKTSTEYSVTQPEQFLSARAIERRQRQQLEIDSTDIPVSSTYLTALEELRCTVVAKSKWMNTVSVHCIDSALVDTVKELYFVDSTMFVWKVDTTAVKKKRVTFKKTKTIEKPLGDYGYGFDQINMVNGIALHNGGYRGKGMEIAVIDAGYKNFKNILLLDNVSIKGYKDFVYEGEDMFESSDHGLKVLSVMSGNRPGIFVGTAPEAKYWLLRSEDGRSEYPVEEDYWVAAAEYADSIGVDVINTSLGYTKYNAPAQSYTQEQLDGETAFITKAADRAVSKGIFVEISAGNEGGNNWRRITVPADAERVLTVGSIKRDSLVSYFSSRGLDIEGKIKPDVVALGSAICVIDSTGEIDQSNGTSFAGPVMSGMAACLWEAYPGLTNLQLLDAIRRSAHKYEAPNNSYGYGIPNMEKAMEIAKEISETRNIKMQ